MTEADGRADDRVRLQVKTTSAASLRRVAAALAGMIEAPLVLLLEGDLGAGKTTFVKGFVHALPGGQTLTVQSPTFALAKTYATTPRVHHLDLYRLEDEAALFDLGLIEQILEDDAVSCVEWPRGLERSLGSTPVARLGFSSAAGSVRPLSLDLPSSKLRDAAAAAGALKKAAGPQRSPRSEA